LSGKEIKKRSKQSRERSQTSIKNGKTLNTMFETMDMVMFALKPRKML